MCTCMHTQPHTHAHTYGYTHMCHTFTHVCIHLTHVWAYTFTHTHTPFSTNPLLLFTSLAGTGNLAPPSQEDLGTVVSARQGLPSGSLTVGTGT